MYFAVMFLNNFCSKQWVENCRRNDLSCKDTVTLYKNYRLGVKHFEDSCFRNFMENRLHDTAIPTIFPSRPSVKRKLYNAEASG